jgi:phosphoglycolate phosphatase-like HAD superfamily hydrolase
MAYSLIAPLEARRPGLIVFDKDGTLIEFHGMWGGWLRELAARLEAETGLALAGDLYRFMAFDDATGRVIAGGRLALAPLAEAYHDVLGFLAGRGLAPAAAEAALAAAWHYPDPIALAQPLADLPLLFGQLRGLGLKLAVATSDDRAGTLATLAGLGATGLVDAVVCADDGVPIKPAPDMVLRACAATGVPPARTVVVGDAVVDLDMARAAGAFAVGVATGVTAAEALSPHADLMLPDVAALLSR